MDLLALNDDINRAVYGEWMMLVFILVGLYLSLRTGFVQFGRLGTALRETQEEVGIDGQYVEVLGQLNTYVTVTAFSVTPVVALVRPGFTLIPNPDEVADVFEVPLRFLLDPRHHERHYLELDGMRREWFAMPYQDGLHQRYIWGATAGMLRNFYRFMMA